MTSHLENTRDKEIALINALQFRNAILLLKCIDADEFSAALFGNEFEWTDPVPLGLWNAYQKDPVKFFIHTSDAHRNALWAIIEKRLTRGEKND